MYGNIVSSAYEVHSPALKKTLQSSYTLYFYAPREQLCLERSQMTFNVLQISDFLHIFGRITFFHQASKGNASIEREDAKNIEDFFEHFTKHTVHFQDYAPEYIAPAM